MQLATDTDHESRSCDVGFVNHSDDLELVQQLRSRVVYLQNLLSPKIQDLLSGSLKHQSGVWFNSAAACPVPASVLLGLEEAMLKPHVTLARGSDAWTQEMERVKVKSVRTFCDVYTKGNGALIFGHNTNHVLLSLKRAILHRGGDLVVVHGDPDHKTSYAFSDDPCWKERRLIQYSENGFYKSVALENLPAGSVFLMTALHHMYGTVQVSSLQHIQKNAQVVVDLSQAMSSMTPTQIGIFLERADAAVFNIGKVFSPLSMGVLWIRDENFAKDILEVNPELQGSISGLQISAFAGSINFTSQAVDDVWNEYVACLTKYTLASISSLSNVSVVGCSTWRRPTDRLGLITFNVSHMSAQELGVYLGANEFHVRADGSCTGDNKAGYKFDHVRICLLPHISVEDVDRLVLAVKECA